MMKEGDVDYVAFLTDNSNKSQDGNKGNMQYVSCTKRRAVIIGICIFIAILVIALIAAFARPVLRCPIVKGPPSEKGGATSTPEPPKPSGPPPYGKWNDIRLPPFILPIHYSLHMRPNLTAAFFSGSVNVTLTVNQSTDFLIIHAKNLTLKEPQLLGPGAPQTTAWGEIPQHDQVYVEFDGSLAPNTNYTLRLEFEAHLHRDLVGFYLSSYTTKNNETKLVAATQFEPTSARKAFPCFDEPGLKATFKLTIWHDSDLEAFANMGVSSVGFDGGSRVTDFHTSLRMSTYLVAFVVCDGYKDTYVNFNYGGRIMKLSVLVPSKQVPQGNFARDIMAKSLKFYNEFFNIPYPMDKLDLIAIPDFGPGAMENWGLITFRMSSLLYDDVLTPVKSKERIASTVAHELAHQWFGNLVTMEWWDDLWLNEGFATFLENVALDHIGKEWEAMATFPCTTTQPALDLDALRASHPISASVHDPADIDALFDSISYNKGAAVIYMLQSFLGSDPLKMGLTHYLTNYRFKNARTEDLWDAFTNVTSGQLNVEEVMNTWTRQKGYPLIQLKVSGGRLWANQTRFRLVGDESDEATTDDLSEFGYKWFVPLTIMTDANQTSQLYWMNKTDVQIPFDGTAKWIKANTNQTGFYRVNYENSNWEALIEQLNTDHEVLSASDRGGLLDDAFTLARTGELAVPLTMNLTKYLSKERHFAPWATALPHFFDLCKLGWDSPWLPHVKAHILEVLRPVTEDLGWKDEGSLLQKKLRAEVLLSGLSLGDEKVFAEATKRFYAWTNGSQVPANLKDIVYRAGIIRGGRKEWNFCWSKYVSSQVPSEKALLLHALGASRDMWQLNQFLQFSLDPEKIKAQDVHTVIGVVAENPIGHLETWRFLRQHWDTIYNLFKETTFSLDSIISDVVSRFTTEYDYEEVKGFFAKVDLKAGKIALEQALERVRANIFWKKNIEKHMQLWLEQQPLQVR
ncbi:glutamyl aminopeptidase-like isoform X2 [Ornithodoros turicata]|uniref:glutamyl aminopeptidase-like isoform X2 n=1 Tax=Ornithodoros turicata TaxID=34597 RepID=UPI003139007D